METPPSNVQARNIGYNPNYRLETPVINSNNHDEFLKNEYINKLNTKMLKVQSPLNDKETLLKRMNELRKKLIYVEETNWMFENNDGINAVENLPNLL